MSTAVPVAPRRVLSTLNQDGSRVRLRPRVSVGRFFRARRVVGYGLILLFVALPYIRIGGAPAILLDLVSRRFAFFGAIFRPTDGLLLMLVGLSIVLTVFLVTALFGRVWCGWACPQTVYLEWVFRPIERLWEGGAATARQRGGRAAEIAWWRRAGKLATYVVLSMFVAHIFLAYFVGIDQLVAWVQASPVEHPGGFLVMAGVTGLMLFDFGYFREQTCIVACPYGRLQTVLIDKQSLIVGYDARRGEPRGKLRRVAPVETGAPRQGDCVDCKACVATCPVGIDIRDGLQMECVGCTQCIDACDAIMDRVGRPRGLIRYTSQDELAGKTRHILRGRVLVYPALLAVAVVSLVVLLGDRATAEVTLLRSEGAPFSQLPDGQVSSRLTLKIENRTEVPHRYTIALVGTAEAHLIVPTPVMAIGAESSMVVPLFVVAPARDFVEGARAVELRIADEAGFARSVRATALGPEGGAR